MNNGWVDARDRLPQVGDHIELQMGATPEAVSGTLCGVSKITHPILRAEDWMFINPFDRKTRVWMRYWRLVQ